MSSCFVLIVDLAHDEEAQVAVQEVMGELRFLARCFDLPLPPGAWWGPLPAGESPQRFGEALADTLVRREVSFRGVVAVKAESVGAAHGDAARRLFAAQLASGREDRSDR